MTNLDEKIIDEIREKAEEESEKMSIAYRKKK